MALEARAQKRIVDCLAQVSPPVIAAYLFGSAARDETTLFSDVDIAVYLDEPSRERRVAAYPHLHRQLAQALSNGPLDLILLNDAPPALANRIIAGDLLYCIDELQRTHLEAKFLADYQDFLPGLREYDRFLHARIRAGLFGKWSPMMIDSQRINDRLAYIQTTLQRLQSRQPFSLETLKSDPDKRGATLYELQTCIEAMSDIANHIVAATGLRKPQERGEAFTILAEAGILSQTLAQELVEAVGMRNVLVHGYLNVVFELVYQTLQNDLHYIEDFAQHIVDYLKTLSPNSE
jgi:uncharacterized protein YutE (UPF0331/DUF86 family)/predicted nucleotidyltransferase